MILNIGIWHKTGKECSINFQDSGFLCFIFKKSEYFVQMTGTRFPCSVCCKAVANNHNVLCCYSCDKWVHIKCNFLNKKNLPKASKR